MNFSLPHVRNNNKRPFRGDGGGSHSKRPTPMDDLSDLPTHLPNSGGASNLSASAEPLSVLGNRVEDVQVDGREKSPVQGGAAEPVAGDQSREAIFIEGTNISLQTDEDIAAWIAERKKNWPTRENIERKLASAAGAQGQESPKDSRHSGHSGQSTQLGQLSSSGSSSSLMSGKNAESSKRNVCKYFAKNNRCKFGAKCKNLHEPSKPSNKTSINGIAVSIPKRYKDSAEKGSLFTKLVQRDLYANENDFVLSFLQYLQSKHMIEIDADYS